MTLLFVRRSRGRWGRLHSRPGRPQGFLRAATLASLAACASACAAIWTPTWTTIEGPDGERILHRKIGFSLVRADVLAARRGTAGVWSSEQVAGADIAYRRSDGSQISLRTECDRGVTRAPLRARQLLIGIAERDELQGYEVEIQGLRGWVQRLIARQGGGPVRLKTVTVVDGNCTLDWLLVQPADSEPAEDLFDAWWGSYVRPAPQVGEREAPTDVLSEALPAADSEARR